MQAMNDVVIHRGRHPHLTITECSVDDEFLTAAVADGLVVSTPTGSTAYSLSAGGPLVHPSVNSLLLTPICPRSLSFRPALLPASSVLRLRLSKKSRETADVAVDGTHVHRLAWDEYVEVRMSEFSIPCVSRTGQGRDWVEDINRTLKWNQGFVNNTFS
ncbi:NADH kinase pos5 [Thoreauomyces humboldtii]|nr:NADH kinase pos5 [Thoreauomyces humboldtii]